MAIVERKLQRGVVFWVVFTWQGEDRWERSGSDRRKAERLEAKRKAEVKAGTYVPPRNRATTVRDFMQSTIDKMTNRAARNDVANVEGHVFPRAWFADMLIDDVRPKDVLRLVMELKSSPSARTGRPLSPKTVSNVYATIRTIFKSARFHEVIQEDPCALPSGVISRKTKKRTPYLDEEVRRLLAPIEGLGADVTMFATLLFYTGMRKGEVAGRRWRDYDRNARPLGSLSVHTQYNDEPLKTDDAEADRPRLVPVHPELAKALDAWWATGFEEVYCRRPTADDFIVPHRGGRGMEAGGAHSQASAYKLWLRLCAAAHVTNRTLHSSRHTFISRARRGGAQKDIVEKITHNSSGDIVDAYTTWDWQPLCAAVLCLTYELDRELDAVTSAAPEKLRLQDSNRAPRRASKAKVANSGDGDAAEEPPSTAGIASPAADSAAAQAPFPAPRDVQGYVARRLREALPAVLARDEAAALRPLARAAKALERGAAPKRKAVAS